MDFMATEMIIKMNDVSSDQALNYSASIGVPKAIYDREYKFTCIPAEAQENVDDFEASLRRFYDKQIDRISETERTRFSTIIQEETSRWSENQDTMMCRHQDFLYHLRDYYSWTARPEIDEYLAKHKLSRRTWCKDLAEEDREQVYDLLKKNRLVFDSTVDREFVLDLDLDINYYEVHSFLSEAKYKRLTQYRKLNIHPISKLSNQGVNDLNEFLMCSTPDGLKILSVCAGGFIDYSPLKEGLSAAMRYIREQIYFAGMIFDSAALIDVFEKGSK